jgi:hypothetical protein
LGPVEGREFVRVWRDGVGEYESRVGAFQIRLKWTTTDDCKRALRILAVYDLDRYSMGAVDIVATTAGAGKTPKAAGWVFRT